MSKKISQLPDGGFIIPGDYIPFIRGGVTYKGKIQSGLLGSLVGFNFNSLTDQAITLFGGTKFYITDVVLRNVSLQLSTAKNFAVNDAVARGGNDIFNIDSGTGGVEELQFIDVQFPNKGNLSMKDIYHKVIALTVANQPTGHINPAIAGYEIATNTIYASVQTIQGAAATGDVLIYGHIIE